jgi:hypothetical protein
MFTHCWFAGGTLAQAQVLQVLPCLGVQKGFALSAFSAGGLGSCLCGASSQNLVHFKKNEQHESQSHHPSIITFVSEKISILHILITTTQHYNHD